MRPGRFTAVVLLAAIAPMGLASYAAAHPTPGESLGLEAAAENVTAGDHAAKSDGFRLLGHDDVGGGGLNGDVWAHRGFAYLGVWSAGCPATGVKVVDYRDPRDPSFVSVLQNDEGTSAEDIVVRRVKSADFAGSLAVTGIQVCEDVADPFFRGLQFFDVTNPTDPVELGRWEAPELSVGCHEVDLVERDDGRVLAGCANVFAEQINGTDELVLVDATDPANPETAGGWSVGADLGVDPATTEENIGCGPATFNHSVRFVNEGKGVYGSYWDFGAVLLDIRDPAHPDYISRADIAPPDEDGDVHSVVRAGGTLVVNAEDFSPVDCPGEFDGWGEAHLFDVSDPAEPEHVGTFSTKDSRSERTDGFFSIHNTEIAKGTQAISSWYSDGIVWWDYADPSDPEKRGQFVPPAAEDPSGFLPTAPIVWGVYLDRQHDLVLASDMNSGLWILKAVGLGDY